MKKINWKQKLTSRKFWAAVAGFVAALLVVFCVDDLTIEKVVGLIGSMGVLAAYIVGEGMVDAARIDASVSEDKDDDFLKDFPEEIK